MNQAEIFEKLRIQEENMRKPPVFFVYYDNRTNRITSVRNYLDESDTNPYVQFNQNEFDFNSPDFNILNFVIDPVDKKINKVVEENPVSLATIDTFIYEIPKIVSDKRITYADNPFDLLIEQNNGLREFKIKLSKMLRDKFLTQNLLSQEMFVYVTATNDPNILYKTLQFTFHDVIVNEYYTIPFDDFQGNNVNIFAIKFFENYLHVDVRNE